MCTVWHVVYILSRYRRGGATARLEAQMTTNTETCDRCDGTLTEREIALAWPVPLMRGEDCEYICPSCYGDEAFCPQGHTLRGDTEGSDCSECEVAS